MPERPRLRAALSDRLCTQRCGAAPGAGAQPALPGAAMLGSEGALPVRVSLRDRGEDSQRADLAEPAWLCGAKRHREEPKERFQLVLEQ